MQRVQRGVRSAAAAAAASPYVAEEQSPEDILQTVRSLIRAAAIGSNRQHPVDVGRICLGESHSFLVTDTSSPRTMNPIDMASDGLCITCTAWKLCKALKVGGSWAHSAGSVNARDERRRDAFSQFEDANELESRAFDWAGTDVEALPRNTIHPMISRLDRPEAETLWPGMKRLLAGEEPLPTDWSGFRQLHPCPINPNNPTPPTLQRLYHASHVLSMTTESIDLIQEVTAGSQLPQHTPGN